jgi:hypothetical protein
MTVRGERRTRLAATAVLVAISLLFGGCVYLRLLELKHQIAAFDRNFAVQTDDGVRIVCLNPVLLSEDVRWLGLTPEQVKTVGHAEQWQVRWVKQLPPGVHETGTYDIVITMMFAEDKLTRVAIPERYFAVMPKKLLVDLLRSLGGAKVDRDRRSVEAQLAGNRPDLPAIQKLLGRPSEESTVNGQSLFRYRYLPASSRGLARGAALDVAVYFDPPTGQLERWVAHTPVGTIGFNFH